MKDILVYHLNDCLAALACVVIAFSAFLRVNHLGRTENPCEKMVLFCVGCGAIGVVASPLTYTWMYIETVEVMLLLGVAAYAMYLSAPYWHELPGLNRRSVRRNRQQQHSVAD